MAFNGFTPDTLRFIADLNEHNDRAWFAENRDRYERAVLGPQKEFVAAIGAAFGQVDTRVQAVPAVNKSIFRINRDIRFSRDKSPYKTHCDVFFWIGDKRKNDPGYFMRLAPEEIWIGCGQHSLEPDQLARLRAAIAAPASGEELERLLVPLEAAGFSVGEKGLARVPAGFSADSPRAELLKFTVMHAILAVAPPEELTTPQFVDWSMERFLKTKPLVDWLVEHVG